MAKRAAILRGLVLAALATTSCVHKAEGPAPPASPPTAFAGTFEPTPREEVQEGYATWYGGKLAGHKTASGEVFDPSQMTAAHRTLPFGTWVEVTRVDTGQRVRVRITDRGPFGHEDRIIDLARGAAAKIDLVKKGVARVQLRVVDGPE